MGISVQILEEEDDEDEDAMFNEVPAPPPAKKILEEEDDDDDDSGEDDMFKVVPQAKPTSDDFMDDDDVSSISTSIVTKVEGDFGDGILQGGSLRRKSSGYPDAIGVIRTMNEGGDSFEVEFLHDDSDEEPE